MTDDTSEQTAPDSGDPVDPVEPVEDTAAADHADEQEDEAPTGSGGHAAGGPGAQLQQVTAGPRPPLPPKRTGMFLDPDDLRHHVGGLLRAMLGGYQVDAYGNYTFVHDGARVFVTCGASPIGPQVGVFSVTNLELDLTPDLAVFIATTNHRLGFGSLSYDPDSHSVWLRHTLLGTTLDAPELQTAVAAVASTAAQVDDHIAETFGGRTFDEAPEDVQQQTRPPETPQESYTPGGRMGYL